jgi:hypothetical protein
MDAFDSAADAVDDAISEMISLMQAGIADGHYPDEVRPMWMWRDEAYQLGREIGRAHVVGGAGQHPVALHGPGPC